MKLRLGIDLVGVLLYLFFVLAFGSRVQASENLKRRLDRIRYSNRYRGDEAEQLSKPLAERIFKPALNKIVHVVGTILPLSKKAQQQMDESLRSAGIKKTASEYFASLILLFLAAAVALLLVCWLVLRVDLSTTLFYLLFALMCFYTIARFDLKKKITQRAERIEGDMPEILDLLSVSVSAGLGFDQAMQYVVEKTDGELTAELAITQREIRLGRSRDEALRGLAERCKVDALRMFVSAITQADNLGIPISNILQVQAENARREHKQKVEEKAAKLPVKMLIPLVFFIFPVIFIILLGPAVPRVMQAMGAM